MAVCHNVIDGTARGCCKTPGRRAESLVTPCKNPNGVRSLVVNSDLCLCLEEEL